MDKWKNQGEGDKVDKAAKDAEKALDGSEHDELLKAEQAGKARSKGEDPLLNKKTTD